VHDKWSGQCRARKARPRHSEAIAVLKGRVIGRGRLHTSGNQIVFHTLAARGLHYTIGKTGRTRHTGTTKRCRCQHGQRQCTCGLKD